MSKYQRADGRTVNQLRPITIERNQSIHAEGSALVTFGSTQVLCIATVEEGVPSWRRESGKGWVSAEYSMLPRATSTRTRRERNGAGGRTMEIQRLIGRSLRAVIDFHRLGERSVTVDCDVIQADGGTRCASITGAFIAMHDAMEWLVSHDRIAVNPIKDAVAAVSVGIHKGESILDLDYREDSSADVDMNIVMTGAGKYVEIQGTAEEEPFDHSQMQQLLEVGHGGLKQIFDIQKQIIAAGRK